MKKLYLSETNRKIGGVCGGIAEYFGKDPTLVRLAFILLIVLTNVLGIVAYILMWLAMPRRTKAE